MGSEILPVMVHRIASILDHPSVYMGGPSHGSIRKARAVLEALREPLEELERCKAVLADPVAVHANMLRGSIAKPAPRSIIHLYGEKAIREALGDTALKDTSDE